MIEANLDVSELNRLVKKLETAPEILENAKRQAFEQAAPKMKQLLDAEIGGTGKVRSWQDSYVGSKGGYAAVRPKAKAYTDKSKRYAVGYVTNAINSGHGFPTPSGKNPRYVPRIQSRRQNVPGRQFYEAAQSKLPDLVRETAEQVVDALVRHLEE